MVTELEERGRTLGPAFGYLESDLSGLDIDVVLRLLRDGDADGAVAYVIRGGVDAELCHAVHASFGSLIARAGSQREDDGSIRADQVGSTQFLKAGQEYAESTIRAQSHLLSLFDGLSSDNVTELMMDARLRTGLLGRGLHFGPARFKSTYANYCTIRSWLDNGEMSLHPHEDISQVEAARDDGFEIGRSIGSIVSFNVCIARADGGGETRIWDLQPSVATRREFGLYDRGYPYPLSFVRDLPYVSIDLDAGDCYFLSATFLHAVAPAVGERVTAGRFLGLTDDDRVLFWT